MNRGAILYREVKQRSDRTTRTRPMGRDRARIKLRCRCLVILWAIRSLCLLWRRGCGPPPVSPVFLTVTLVRAAYWSDAENRTSPRTTNANRTTD